MKRRSAFVALLATGSAAVVEARRTPPDPQRNGRPEPSPRAGPPSSHLPKIHYQMVNRERLVCFERYHSAPQNYSRIQNLHLLQGKAATVTIKRMGMRARTPYRPARTYTVTIDGQPMAQVRMAEGQQFGDAVVDLTAVAQGWHELDIVGLDETESCPKWFAYRDKGEPRTETEMPVLVGTSQLNYGGAQRPAPGIHAWAWVPNDNRAPTTHALAARTYVPFSGTPTVMQSEAVSFWSHAGQSTMVPSINRDGIVSAMGSQVYSWAGSYDPRPAIPLFDGPRGRCTTPYVTHIQISEAVVDGVPRDSLVCCDPWSVYKIDAEGTKVTLFAYRHAGMMTYWSDTQDTSRAKAWSGTLELVGDWSAIPAERRGMRQPWGVAVMPSSVAIDKSRRIPTENNEHPHVTTDRRFKGPVFIVADTLNKRVLKAEFNAVSRTVPAVVTELVIDAGHAWEAVAGEGDTFFLSDSTGHRITEHDGFTGALIRTVLKRDPSLPGDAQLLAWDNSMRLRGTLEEGRAQPVLGPEGLFRLGKWLYFGSHASLSVKRVHLETGAVEYVCDVTRHRKSRFVKISVSDGTFGPAGTVFYWTFGTRPSALARAVLPDGTPWDYGKSLPHLRGGYPFCGAAKNGRAYGYATGIGIVRFFPGPPLDFERYQRGRKEYERNCLYLLHGPAGNSPWGYPPPWGESEDLDYYLSWWWGEAASADHQAARSS